MSQTRREHRRACRKAESHTKAGRADWRERDPVQRAAQGSPTVTPSAGPRRQRLDTMASCSRRASIVLRRCLAATSANRGGTALPIISHAFSI